MKKQSGFTLIEILVAIALIVIFTAVVGVQLTHLPGKARMAAARDQIGRFKVALEVYSSDNGFLPTQEQGLQSLCRKPETAPVPAHYPPEGYLDSRDVPKDPWEHDFAYIVPGSGGKAYEIISYGRDGEQGGEGEDADISSLDL